MSKIKALLKKILESILPAAFWLKIMSSRNRRNNKRLLESWGGLAVNDKLIEKFGFRTISGLFPDLILIESLKEIQIGPFMLGTYEKEIAHWFRGIKEKRFNQILDVGSSFGYYAIGLAKWFPETPVIAFDTDPWAQKATIEMSKANKAGNLSVLGYCDPNWLKENISNNTLIVCDCEGFEFELLDPQKVPTLKTATIIVESHDAPPWTKHLKLIKEFEKTHHVSEASFTGNDNRPTTTDLSFLNSDELALAVGEFRYPYQKWIMLEPR